MIDVFVTVVNLRLVARFLDESHQPDAFNPTEQLGYIQFNCGFQRRIDRIMCHNAQNGMPTTFLSGARSRLVTDGKIGIKRLYRIQTAQVADQHVYYTK